MRKTSKTVAISKVLSDFFTGLGIAWFSGGIIAPLLSKSFTNDSFILGIYSLLVTFTLLFFAIMFRKDIKNGN